ncbi:adenylate/guanylate cyclase domain-containing protein [Opitutus sp. GAS368]|uniref:adenylate/guanylate cyclase domain-containing protein n=1 Tax=Opitutus sp. GAS368 TaxID=1882749 RepID=UPI00087A02AE|nr:adenylate/guanylate cyclase domain-containing protein [Opitutus sp. GAS368]SDS28275.1 adenylate cyclase [Opitutus sp. GAS368]
MAFRVFRFRSFSRQLMLLLAGLIAVVQVAVYLLVTRANESNARKHIEQNLQIGANIFRQNLSERIDYLAGSAKIMSGDYAIKPLLMQSSVDKSTLRSVLLSYIDRVKAPVITIFSPEGDLLAGTDEVLGTENVGPFRYLIRQATTGDMEQASGYSYLGGKLHVLVVVPLYAPYPNVGAWFGLAYPIDTAFANAIKKTTLLDVTFTSNPDEPNPRVLSTTLNRAMAEAIARHATTKQEAAADSEMLTLGGEPYVTLFQSWDLLGEAPVRIALQRSLNAELAPARELENIVLLISLAALAAATIAALWIARGVSQPLQQLAGHTKLVAAGDYTRRIELPREDEIGQLATAFNHMTAGLAERDKVRDLLGKVVSPEIAAQLLQSDLQLGGEEREVTILFCDLRDFTTLSEKLPPTDVLALLNRYLDRMSTIIEQHGGVIDKYIGDAIMALFGAPVATPEAPERAIAAARDMARALDLLNCELDAEGKPTLAFGIGINTARVVAGNMGSKTRLNYTVLGDGVNLASRLEGLTKDPAYATPIIVSEATLAAMKVRLPARELGEVKVKGKAQAVKIFALSAKGESMPPYGTA